MLHKGCLSTGENLHFPRSVQARYVDSIEREVSANELQVVGDPNSTDEGMKQNKYRREVEKEPFLMALVCETISKRKH